MIEESYRNVEIVVKRGISELDINILEKEPKFESRIKVRGVNRLYQRTFREYFNMWLIQDDSLVAKVSDSCYQSGWKVIDSSE